MNTPKALPVSRLRADDMRGAPAAMARAGQRAKEIAYRTGTPLIVFENGKTIEKTVTRDMRTSAESSA